MSKKIIKIAVVVAFALIGGWNIYQNQTSTALPDITLSNVEALARGEGYEGDCDSYCGNSGYMCIINYSDGTSISCPGKAKS